MKKMMIAIVMMFSLSAAFADIVEDLTKIGIDLENNPYEFVESDHNWKKAKKVYPKNKDLKLIVDDGYMYIKDLKSNEEIRVLIPTN